MNLQNEELDERRAHVSCNMHVNVHHVRIITVQLDVLLSVLNFNASVLYYVNTGGRREKPRAVHNCNFNWPCYSCCWT